METQTAGVKRKGTPKTLRGKGRKEKECLALQAKPALEAPGRTKNCHTLHRLTDKKGARVETLKGDQQPSVAPARRLYSHLRYRIKKKKKEKGVSNDRGGDRAAWPRGGEKGPKRSPEVSCGAERGGKERDDKGEKERRGRDGLSARPRQARPREGEVKGHLLSVANEVWERLQCTLLQSIGRRGRELSLSLRGGVTPYRPRGKI